MTRFEGSFQSKHRNYDLGQAECHEEKDDHCDYDPDRDRDPDQFLVALLAHFALELKAGKDGVDRKDAAGKDQQERRKDHPVKPVRKEIYDH